MALAPAGTLVFVTHSSGNHGQAVALAARAAGRRAAIVVPRTAPQCKVDSLGSTLAALFISIH